MKLKFKGVMKKQVWSGHGLPHSTEDPRTWESSWLRRVLKQGGKTRKGMRKLAYGILVNRKVA